MSGEQALQDQGGADEQRKSFEMRTVQRLRDDITAGPHDCGGSGEAYGPPEGTGNPLIQHSQRAQALGHEKERHQNAALEAGPVQDDEHDREPQARRGGETADGVHNQAHRRIIPCRLYIGK